MIGGDFPAVFLFVSFVVSRGNTSFILLFYWPPHVENCASRPVGRVGPTFDSTGAGSRSKENMRLTSDLNSVSSLLSKQAVILLHEELAYPTIPSEVNRSTLGLTGGSYLALREPERFVLPVRMVGLLTLTTFSVQSLVILTRSRQSLIIKTWLRLPRT